VALLIALAFSAFFIGCIDPLVVEIDTDTYTEFELTGFNAFGGNKENQAGWVTDGATKVGSDGTGSFTGDIGLTVEKLQSARYLVVEMNDGFPKNNFETIWGSYDASGATIGGSDWNQFSSITTAQGGLNAGMGTQDGNIFKMEMSKILKSYPTFRDPKAASIFLLIQHWGNGGTGACIKSAKLLIPDVVEPPPPPEPPLFTGKGSYKVPASGTFNTSFYVDLNEVKESAASGGSPGGLNKIEEDKITAEFTAANQNIYIPFTDEQAAYLQNAGDKKFTIEVTINATYTGSTNYRWTLVNGTGSSWATYELFNQSNTTFGNPNVMGTYSGNPSTLKPGVTNQGTIIKGFLFQARDNASGVTSKIELESILIEVSGTGTDPNELTGFEFEIDWLYDDIDAPYAGANVPTKVTGENFGTPTAPVYYYDGAITWTPAPVGGKFVPMTQYTANIVVTPKLGNYIGIVDSTTVTVDTNPAVFLPASRTVTYTFPKDTGINSEPAKRPEYSGTKLTVSITNASDVTSSIDATEVKAKNGIIGYKADNSGFIFSSQGAGGGYQEEYPKFKINLNATLAANSTIMFKYKGIDGDIAWKNVGIAVCTAEPTGDVNITSTDPVKNGSTNVGNVIWKGSYENDGQKEIEFEAPISAAITATSDLWFVITMHGGQRKAFEIYDIRFLPPPPTSVKVKVGDADQSVVPVAMGDGTTVKMLYSSLGYTYKKAQWATGYVYFPVDLGAGKTISDYASVKVTISGSGSDANYKSAGVIVRGVAFTGGALTQANEANLGTTWDGVGGYSSGSVEREWAIIATPVAGGACIVEDSATGKDVFICIYVHAPVDQTYTISNIELVPKP
jgi:hypothetical protein